jgi:Fe-S-cluster-containing dehydrogenase component
MGRMYDTREAGDVFLQLARQAGKELSRGGAPPPDFPSWLRERWSGMAGGAATDVFWATALRSGGVWPKGAAVGGGAPGATGIGAVKFVPPPASPAQSDVVELWPWGSVLLFDGRLSNRGWIQEVPDPSSFILWGSWIDLHPLKAKVLGISDGDVAELTTQYGSLRAPVRVTKEVVDGTAAIAFGQGHTALGKAARGVGANAFALLGPPQQGSVFVSCRIRKVGRKQWDQLIRNSISEQQHGREVVQWVKLSELSSMSPGQGDKLIMPLPEGYRSGKDMYPRREYTKHRWAMVVDLHRCIGCGACTVACYAENNIPVVGKERIAIQEGREMSWLRVPPYEKPGTSLRVGWLPLLCQHCDAAPCEPVCPVFAAVHNEEGLNAQIYNRCIGTRYCSNNCPYKVRRFNWINIVWPKPLDMQLNPEVTVRERGVMEKCTFCVQRIRQAEYRAVREKRPVRDGEITPACAQTCPTRAFTFGDLLDPNSRVSQLTRNDPRRYHLLEELNTKPAVTFLRRIDVDDEDAPLAT